MHEHPVNPIWDQTWNRVIYSHGIAKIAHIIDSSKEHHAISLVVNHDELASDTATVSCIHIFRQFSADPIMSKLREQR